MATATQTFQALIKADAKGAVQDLRKFNGEIEKATVDGAKRTDQLGAAFTRVGGIVAGLGIANVMKDSVDAASNLEESTNAVHQAFGDAANGVLRFGDNAVNAYGLSQRAFNDMALGLSGFAEQLSAGGAGSVPDLIDDLVGRATDFGSVWNKETSEVANAFRSFLSGESEPMKQFGIVIDEAAVKTRALEMGLADTTAELTTQDKQLARYNLLMEETAYTAGDWARTSDGLAGSQKKLTADLENASAALGAELLPLAATAASTMADFAGVLKDMPPAARQFTVGAAAVALGLATIGARATSTLALLGLVAGGVKSVGAGVRGDMDFLNREVSLLERPFQLAGQFGFALGSGDGWGAWRDEATEALDDAEFAATQFDGTLLASIETTDEARAVMRDYADSLGLSDDAAQHVYNTLIAEYMPAIREAEGATSDAAKETMIAAEMQRDQARAAHHTATVMGDLKRRQEEAAAATERHRQAVHDLFEEVNNNLSTAFDYESAMIDTENAVQDFADAAVAAIDVANDSEASAADRERALRDMRQAEIDAANSALDAAGKYAESQGAIEGTTTFAMLQREELERLKEKFPELTDEIDIFIAELDKIPAVKTVSLIIERDRVNSQLQRSGVTARVDEFGNLRQFDSGGVVPGPRGSAQLVVAHGGETILPTHKGPVGLPGGGGGNVYNINVSAPAGANADEFGRLVREAIRRETRWSGNVTGWSAA